MRTGDVRAGIRRTELAGTTAKNWSESMTVNSAAVKSMDVKFSGQVALIAGGTGGLGRAVSLAFLAEEAKVVVTYRKQEEFDALKKATGSNAASLEGYSVDVTDEAAVGQLVERVVAKYGRLDAVVNAVGGYASGKLWELDSKVFDQMLAVNLRSGYVLA